MAIKDYGPATSGYLDPADRAWETVVIQAGKPILDKELNLVQDVEQEAELVTRRRSFPSGWMSDQFLNVTQSGLLNALVTTANTIQLATQRAHVNGWLVHVADTGDATELNVLSLGAGPVGAGTKRTDLIILEVWRRLIPAAPTATGKSPAARIWRYGNVKIPSASDLALNFADDILDGAVGSETTKRVQIQYRLRVISAVDLFTFPNGIDDPTVVANTVPATAAAPDGTATIYTYTNQSSLGDPGLWRTGNGDPTNTLGTVDGYMYALPLCAVFRRNTTAFARNTNHNGGVAFPGPSDRPDSLFSDNIVARDILDLRFGTSPTGWDLQEVAQRNLHLLLDNQIQTEIGATLLGGGLHGHTVMWADEIGVSNANGGDGTTTGDTPGAEFIGEFDAVRRTFSDRTIYETIVLRFTPADGSGGGPSWADGDTITISPSALPIWPYTAFNWTAFAPSTISFVDIVRVAYLGESLGQNSVNVTTDTTSPRWSIEGLGSVPQGALTFRIHTTIGGASPIYISVLIAYPSGAGLFRTPTAIFANNAVLPTLQGVFINNPAQLPAGSPILYSALQIPTFNTPNREVSLSYTTVSHSRTFFSTSTTTTIALPERAITGTVSISQAPGGPYGGSITVSSDGYLLTLSPAVGGGGVTVTVTYQSIRPLPQNDEQLTVYYEARLPQTVREALLGTSLSLIPRLVTQDVYALTAGSGSDGQGYPFPSAYVQSGGVYPTSGGTFTGDHELDGALRVSVTTLFADTGFLRLPAHVPVVPLPDDFVFSRVPGDVDAEGRTFFKALTSAYKPLGVAQPLSDPKRHKNFLPILCELSVDTPFGFKGELVLLLLTRWASFDDENTIAFMSSLVSNRSSASVYKLKGQLLGNRRS
jgi:hypothetical protein